MTSIKTQSYLGQRIGATVIDYFILCVFSFAYVMIVGEPNEEGGKTVNGLPALVPVVFWFVWLVIPEAIWSRTLGHYSTGIKTVTLHGDKPAFWQSFVRRLSDIIDISCCFGLIAFILVQTTPNKQRLGDILAKTLVVDKNFQVGSDFEFENQAQNQ